MSAHVALDRLRDFACGLLVEAEADGLLDHCWSCKTCGDRLAVILALRETRAREGARRVRAFGLTAAAVVLALLTGLLWRSWPAPAGGTAMPPIAATPGAPKGGDGAVAGAGMERGGMARLATQAPPARDLVTFLFDFNDMDPPQVSTADYALAKRRGLELIVDARYGEAVDVLDPLAAAHPEDPDLAAYLGIGLYLRGDGTEEVALLLARGAGSNLEAVANTSTWYLANHYVRAGNRERAEIVLEELAGKEDEDALVRAAAHLLQLLQETKLP